MGGAQEQTLTFRAPRTTSDRREEGPLMYVYHGQREARILGHSECF